MKLVEDLIIRQIISYEKAIQSNIGQTEINTEVFVIVPKEEDCYYALRDIHFLWKNIRGTFNDYITLPKSTGYQALETSIIKKDGSIIKFYIQTRAMYEYFRFGITLRCFSKSYKGKKIQLPWVDYLKKIHTETKDISSDYLAALSVDLVRKLISFKGNQES